MLLPSRFGSVFMFSHTLTSLNMLLVIMPSQVILFSINPFCKRHLPCQCGQLQNSVNLREANFGAEASFLVNMLDVHDNVRLASLDKDNSVLAV
ncbi:hypothetical protein XENORESO_004057 [Xenotaenia resolanae]|uniref:Uncharacterized protein n=1 Tax=Xenotaenia resolanae TaxID=208358 RepID=A0ABV0WP65_9TELE